MTRLSKENWVDFALSRLASHGFTDLKADVLAKLLKVSRGSFYWHFPDVAAFHEAVLKGWAARSLEAAEALDPALPPEERLALLMQAAQGSDHGLERAIRAWAQSNPLVAAQVLDLDRFRLRALTEILQETGLPRPIASQRAKLLYAAAVGLGEIDATLISLSATDITEIAGLLTTGSGGSEGKSTDP